MVWNSISNEKLKMNRSIVKLNAVKNNVTFNAFCKNNILLENRHVQVFLDEFKVGFKFIKNQEIGSYRLNIRPTKATIAGFCSKKLFVKLFGTGLTDELHGYFEMFKTEDGFYAIDLKSKLRFNEINECNISNRQKINRLQRHKSAAQSNHFGGGTAL